MGEFVLVGLWEQFCENDGKDARRDKDGTVPAETGRVVSLGIRDIRDNEIDVTYVLRIRIVGFVC